MLSRKKRGVITDKNISSAESVDGIMVVRIAGAFVMESTPSVCMRLDRIGKKDREHGIVLDFSDVEKIDTAAFACLIKIIRDTIKDPNRIAIANLEGAGQELAKILKLCKVIHHFTSVKDAVSFLKKYLSPR